MVMLVRKLIRRIDDWKRQRGELTKGRKGCELKILAARRGRRLMIVGRGSS